MSATERQPKAEPPTGVTSPVGQEPRAADPNLEETVKRLNASLRTRGTAADFSDEALATLLKLQLDYVEEVGGEAIRLANRNQADVVSAADLEGADRTVRPTTQGKAWLEAIGGILAGAGTGTFLQIAVTKNPSVLGLSISAIVAVVGFSVVAATLFSRVRVG